MSSAKPQIVVVGHCYLPFVFASVVPNREVPQYWHRRQ